MPLVYAFVNAPHFRNKRGINIDLQRGNELNLNLAPAGVKKLDSEEVLRIILRATNRKSSEFRPIYSSQDLLLFSASRTSAEG